MRKSIMEMRASASLVPENNILKSIINEFDFNNYKRSYPFIVKFYFQMHDQGIFNNPKNSTKVEPSTSNEVFVQTIKKEGNTLVNGPAILYDKKQDILDLLSELPQRKSFRDINNYNVISSLRNLEFFHKVLDYLFDNPFNPKFSEYAYEAFNRLKYSIHNIKLSPSEYK